MLKQTQRWKTWSLISTYSGDLYAFYTIGTCIVCSYKLFLYDITLFASQSSFPKWWLAEIFRIYCSLWLNVCYATEIYSQVSSITKSLNHRINFPILDTIMRYSWSIKGNMHVGHRILSQTSLGHTLVL